MAATAAPGDREESLAVREAQAGRVIQGVEMEAQEAGGPSEIPEGKEVRAARVAIARGMATAVPAAWAALGALARDPVELGDPVEQGGRVLATAREAQEGQVALGETAARQPAPEVKVGTAETAAMGRALVRGDKAEMAGWGDRALRRGATVAMEVRVAVDRPRARAARVGWVDPAVLRARMGSRGIQDVEPRERAAGRSLAWFSRRSVCSSRCSVDGDTTAPDKVQEIRVSPPWSARCRHPRLRPWTLRGSDDP
jgi:hypothetical protein